MNGKHLVSIGWIIVGLALASFGCKTAEKSSLPENRAVGPVSGTSDTFVVSTGQLIRPAGKILEYEGRPVDLALTSDARKLFVKDSQHLTEIDVSSWSIRTQLKFPSGAAGSMHGIAISADQSRLYVSTSKALCQAVVDGESLRWEKSIELPGSTKETASYPCGIALSRDGATAFVCLSMNNTVAEIDLRQGELVREIPVGVAPFDVEINASGNELYVSNWGGRRAGAGEKVELSAGTPTLVDERGVASSGTVGVIDLQSHRQVEQIEVGLHPSDLKLSRDSKTLFVANANSDTVSLIDTATRRVSQTVNTRPDATLPFGSAPNALALDADEKFLFAANGGNNAIAVIELGEKAALKGFIPAGWYPGALASGGGALFVANVKGIGSRPPSASGKWNSHGKRGTVASVDLPTSNELAKMTRQVLADALVPESLRALERADANQKPVPVPRRAGEPSVFQHVVYIIKENRTYDQVFGDLPRGNNDPNLCMFGRRITPNQHALAEQFVLLDNFYCNGVVSADGHAWATEGTAVDYLEKAQGSWSRSYPFGGDDPLAVASGGFIWDQVLARGLSFRNYGEMSLSQPQPKGTFSEIYRDYVEHGGRFSWRNNITGERLREYSHPTYPGWNLRIPDQVRADIFLSEFAEFQQRNFFPNLSIVYVPNDHTSGTNPGAPTPAAQVADNDLAVGRVVDAISHSRFWPTTCIFVVEDDPQNGFDHVDGHRSTCLVISPYTKRQSVVGHFYNQTSVLRTIELILGLNAMTQHDAMAPTMEACFTSKPELSTYSAIPSNVPLDQLNPKKSATSAASMTLNFEEPDKITEDTLNRILWAATKGDATRYPAELAGAHGRGLPRLGLRLDANVVQDADD
jgi:YVTN family beta-propeller protein